MSTRWNRTGGLWRRLGERLERGRLARAQRSEDRRRAAALQIRAAEDERRRRNIERRREVARSFR